MKIKIERKSKDIIKCDNCKKPAEYYTQFSENTTLWEINKNGLDFEINNWSDNVDPETIYYCEKCAEAEGLL